MPNTTASQGPGRGALSVVQRIFTLLLSIAQTRLELAAVELEEEKSHLVQLLIMAGLTLLFAGFCLMGLFILVCLAIDPAYRVVTLIAITGTLFCLAIGVGFWTLSKARRSTFLKETRAQLKNDRHRLEKDR
ncbi:Inner membrane protein yqjE [Leminorella richardii]|uniref:Inner membrane protein yqjE n=1 Tax=Leminorella richardii TaxID=158841 RepID=A0A2X4UXG9_9GAMM|nr:phage holin family protein [Leminorella richardii]SQI43099.1 Inner membrane protein yqjE [Leminorella richardii]